MEQRYTYENFSQENETRSQLFFTKLRTFKWLILTIGIFLCVGIVLLSSFSSPTKKSVTAIPQVSQQQSLITMYPNKTLHLSLTYDKKQTPLFLIQNVSLSKGTVPKYAKTTVLYTVEYRDVQGTLLYKQPFNVYTMLSAESDANSGTLLLSKRNMVLVTPYLQSIASIQIVTNNNVVSNVYHLSETERKELSLLPTGLIDSVRTTLLHSFSWVHHAFAAENNKLQIVFISDHYEKSDSGKQAFESDAQRFANFLLQKAPFSYRQDQINFKKFWYTNDDLGCDYDQGTFWCNSDVNPETVLADAGISYDKIVIISNKYNGEKRDGSAFIDGTLAFLQNHPKNEKNFVHEFGHIMGLYDEYVYTKPDGSDRFSEDDITLGPNCSNVAQKDERWATTIGDITYFQGCHYANWFRSAEGSAMGRGGKHGYNPDTYPYTDYNLVSQKAINDKLDSLVGTSQSVPIDGGSPQSNKKPIPQITPVYTTQGGTNKCPNPSVTSGIEDAGTGENCIRSTCTEGDWVCALNAAAEWTTKPNPWRDFPPQDSPSQPATPKVDTKIPSTDPAVVSPVQVVTQPQPPVNACGESPNRGFSGSCKKGNYTCVFEECGCGKVNSCVDQYSTKWGSDAWVGRCCGVRK